MTISQKVKSISFSDAGDVKALSVVLADGSHLLLEVTRPQAALMAEDLVRYIARYALERSSTS